MGNEPSPTLILGVDPGLSGAIALVEHTPQSPPRLMGVWDMPIHEIKGKRKLDIYQLATIIDGYAKSIRLAIIEEVGVMTGKEGVVGMFNFGLSTGVVHGICAACFLPIHLTKPAVWKALMGLSHDKDLSRKRASELFPKESHHWSRKKDDGRAEAVLLAVFGRRLV